jgi:hypothetical protein
MYSGGQTRLLNHQNKNGDDSHTSIFNHPYNHNPPYGVEMTFLVDTSVFLEIFLSQENKILPPVGFS